MYCCSCCTGELHQPNSYNLFGLDKRFPRSRKSTNQRAELKVLYPILIMIRIVNHSSHHSMICLVLVHVLSFSRFFLLFSTSRSRNGVCFDGCAWNLLVVRGHQLCERETNLDLFFFFHTSTFFLRCRFWKTNPVFRHMSKRIMVPMTTLWHLGCLYGIKQQPKSHLALSSKSLAGKLWCMDHRHCFIYRSLDNFFQGEGVLKKKKPKTWVN